MLSACTVAGNVTASPSGATWSPGGSPTPSGSATPTPTPTGSFGPAKEDPRLASFYEQKLAWRSCDGDFQCAALTVPLSYDDPAAGSIKLSVLRYPTKNSSERLGSLVLNPGGPGGSGIDYARAARAVTSDALRARYDIVGWDPRGVGTSNPIECLDDKQTDAFIAADASPDDQAEVDRLAALSKQFGQECTSRSPKLVPNVGTREAAKDIDILRAALGDEKLTYLGKSYGTALGATYAELFPQRVGRMVLDGALDPALDGTALAEGQSVGFEVALRRFVENCPSNDDCPLPEDPAAALKKIDELLASIDKQPLKTDDGRPLTEALAVLGIVGSLYDDDSGWPALRYALTQAFTGDGNVLISIADFYTDRDTDGKYTSNGNDALYAVNCWDKPATPGVAETEKLAEQWAVKAPRFGAYLAWGNLPCATWPGHSAVPPHPVAAAGAPPIVVIGTTYDPATPVQWAKALAGQLDEGVYLQWDGDGHTAYQRGSSCVDKAVDTYFIDGTAPKDGTVCR